MALANDPPADVLPQARAKLFEALTELLERDFKAGEKYLDEYKASCQVAVPADASREDVNKLREEGRRRQSNYLYLLAQGREGQGRLVDAFDAYRRFGALAADQELVSVTDEPTVKARPDVWVRGRIAAMLARATPAQRKPLEDLIAQQWQEVQTTKDLDDLRRFVSLFGSLLTEGKHARRQLAARTTTSARSTPTPKPARSNWSATV
jgi:hypothetical protein